MAVYAQIFMLVFWQLPDNKEVAEEIVRAYRQATDPYDKAALLSSLSHSVMSFGFIQEQFVYFRHSRYQIRCRQYARSH